MGKATGNRDGLTRREEVQGLTSGLIGSQDPLSWDDDGIRDPLQLLSIRVREVEHLVSSVVT